MSASQASSRHNYCCHTKQYYSNDIQVLVNKMKIVPRVIIFKKCLKVDKTYQSIISITNKSMYNRRMLYTTDSYDTTVQVHPINLMDNFLQPDTVAQITVLIKPFEKNRINRRRHVHITSEHPNITFSIPIIIMAKGEHISVPSSVEFPSTAVQNFAYQEIILYNKNLKKISFNFKCNNPNIAIHAKSLNISRMDYVKVLLKLNCQNTEVLNDIIKFKFNTGDNFDIRITHVPSELPVFVDTLRIEYEALRFNRVVIKEFRICNESQNNIVFHADLTTEDDSDSELKKTLPDYEDLVQPSQPTETDTHLREIKDHKYQDKFGFRHFQVKPKCSTISANSSLTVQVIFHPILHKDFCSADDDPPFAVFTRLTVSFSDKMKKGNRQIFLNGFINGADIDIIPKMIDLREVYFGEENCVEIKIVNIDGMTDAHVYYYNILSSDTGHVVVTPSEGLTLKPCQSGLFNVQFFAKVETKFMVKLQFKVKNGGIYDTIIKGESQPVRIHCFPDVIDLGVIPIAIPQKRLILVINPLMVPISVHCTVMEDGYEVPLVLNTFNTNDPLPINVKDPVYNIQKSIELEKEQDDGDQKDHENNGNSLEEHETSMLSFQSVVDDTSTYSSDFEEQALDLIPEMATSLVSNLKVTKIFDKTEIECRVAKEALSALLHIPYFLNMDKYSCYTHMDWNALATDPKEIYCNDEIFYLNPNIGKALTIVVIPNVVGYQEKYVTLRLCPILQPPTDDENPNLRQFVDSQHMATNIQIKYQCSVPDITCDNIITMRDHLYAGEWYDFEMKFDNHSQIGGFFYYDMIPDSHLGTIKFSNNVWKYFIGPNSKTRVPCSVKFTKLGYIVLAGLIKFVGVYAGYPFHIKSTVIPPKVKFSPSSIVKTVEVLERLKMHIFIENCTPTTTWFKLNLKDESSVVLDTHGAQLSPTGQAMYATLDIFYRDPGTYKNMLYIIMQFETIEKIPITINVKGMPLFFEPEITIKGLDIGYVLCNTQEDFHENKPNFSKVIKVINKGLRNYRILITRTKCSAKPTCTASPSKAKISVKPNNLVISSLSEEFFTIFINCCEEITIYNEFRIDIIDLLDPKRIRSERFVVTATFIFPQLTWSRRNVTMTYHRTHKFKEHPQWEMIKLTNIAENYMDNVILKITGPFKIKELFEHRFLKELDFSMVGSETKEFFIMLDKELIRNRFNISYEGRLTCFANSKQQKPVNLKVKMYIPTLMIKQNKLILFTKNTEGGIYIELINCGQIKAIYKWKKLKEEWCYIKEEEDTHQVAEIILSDIIRMLDLDPINFEDDSEPNITLRFQKLKCVLKHLDDPIDVKGIINEILNNLDLMGRRYKLDLHLNTIPKADSIEWVTTTMHDVICLHDLEALNDDDFYELIFQLEQQLETKTIYFNRKFAVDSPSVYDETTSSSSETCVYHTLAEVLGNLKLDDSFAESLPSSETCELRRSLYFFQKCGLLQEKEVEMCALHLPPVKKGFEVRAVFQLDVIGGKSQEFQITLVNLDKTLTLSNDNVYLGLKPWYAQFKTKVFAENITNYQISFKIHHVTTPQEQMPKIASGYIKMLNNKIIELPALEKAVIHIEGAMGFSEEFRRELRIAINGGEELTLRLRGHGVMPMLALANRKLSLVKQKLIEVIEEYRLLQKIYYYEVFKPITEIDNDLPETTGEEDYLMKVMSLIMETPLVSMSDSKTSSESRSSEVTEKELRFFRLLKTYVLVNMNEELPNSKVLEQLVETEKFLNHLRFNTETVSLLKMVHQNYLRLPQSYDEKKPLNLKHFTIQPLPFQLKGSILKMEKIFMNQFKKFIISLEFFGPGQLIASVRTAIKIPGLVIDFDVIENSAQKEFNYYRSENKFPDLSDQPYRNKNERQMDAVTDPKVKHAHSYDINKQLQHERNVLIKERKWLMNHYNSLNKSVYMEQKHHFTHCKISTKSANNFSGTKINVVILIRPQKKYFKHNQNIEDYIYIDLHMGPTLPILLHGTVIDRDQTESSTSSSSQTFY